jgi:hypothetical protein
MTVVLLGENLDVASAPTLVVPSAASASITVDSSLPYGKTALVLKITADKGKDLKPPWVIGLTSEDKKAEGAAVRVLAPPIVAAAEPSDGSGAGKAPPSDVASASLEVTQKEGSVMRTVKVPKAASIGDALAIIRADVEKDKSAAPPNANVSVNVQASDATRAEPAR